MLRQKIHVSHPVFMYSLRFQILLIRSKTQHLADLAGAIILVVIAPSIPTIRLLYMGYLRKALGLHLLWPLADLKVDNMGTSREGASNESDDGRVFC